MKILFDIRKGSAGRNYGASLIFQSFDLVENKRTGAIVKVVNELRGIPDVRAEWVNSIIDEVTKTGEVTGRRLSLLQGLLHRRGTSINSLNNECLTY